MGENETSKVHVIMEFNSGPVAGTMWIKLGDRWTPSRSSPEFEQDGTAEKILGPIDANQCVDACARLVNVLRRLGIDADLIEVADD